ncbi:MAG TPA: asparagine synthase (glutamine-hydrolyzing) [Saprospiraceae bacterium]|nr:asparagine synthase (glutamine-hydrolyzing) [Saprospiraceae bacterium]HMP23674.1 asparagine synthase (glutamine-hydrolyzing) [Saprospiraceae bacterium]
MCGITGIIGLETAAGKEGISHMLQALAHRGPDDSGVFADERVALGHQRLSILDLSAQGHQPMHSADGRYVITYNGELYNFQALRAELEQHGYTFRSSTDTEVMLYAYDAWGAACIERFNGMFAFALYDQQAGSILIARDRLGIKPLYYATTAEGVFLFASEVRSILASGLVKPHLNAHALSAYLRYQSVPPPETLVAGVRLLEPGTYLLVKDGQVEQQRYWQAWQGEAISSDTHPEQKVRALLEAAVQRRLISDVPLGAFLSGGIDSSLIVGIMSAGSTQPVQTFTVAFDDARFEDGRYAAMVAKHFKTHHTEVLLQTDDVLAQVPEAVAAQDHPSGDGINTYVVSKAAKASGLTVVLSGLGGDELFAGYAGFKRLYQQQQWQAAWKMIPEAVRTFAAKAISQQTAAIGVQKIAQMLQTDGTLASVYPLTRQFYAPDQVVQLLRQAPNGYDPYHSLLRDELKGKPAQRIISQISYAELSTYMHDVLLRDTDQMSMAHALEVRVPFLDYTLVEYVMQLSDQQKFNQQQQKSLLVNAFAGLLPAEVLHRPKQGFIMPFADWMRGPLRAFCAHHLAVLADQPAFREETIQRFWQDFLQGSKAISWSRLWLLVALGAWVERNGIRFE